MRKFLVITSILFAFILTGVGCSQLVDTSQTQNTEQEKKLKVGAILPLTGPASVWGQSLKKGMELAQEKLRNEGVEINIIYEDSQAKAKKGISAYKKLSNVDNVDVVFSAFSRVSTPLVPLSKEDKLPLFMSVTAAKDLPQKSPYAFRNFATHEMFATKHFSNLEKSEAEEIGVIYINDEYGQSVFSAIKKSAKEKNIDIAESESFKPKSTDVRAQLTNIKAAEPDVIIAVVGTPIEILNIVETKKELNIESNIYEASQILSLRPTRVENKEVVEGVRTLATPFALKEIGNNFRQKFKKEYEEDPIFPAAYSYDIVNLIGKVTEGKKIKGQEFIQKIEKIEKYSGVNGEMEIEESGEINPPLRSVKIKEGKLKKVN